jgi:DNA-binding CsgD family transcriptional regulator
MADSARSARGDLHTLARRAVTGSEFRETVAEAVHSVLPYDGWCLFGLDPSTGLRTFQFGGRGTEHTAEMATNEAMHRDVNRYVDLARADVPAGWLSAAHPAARRSTRFNEILRPQGFASELRVALREDGHLWGALCLFSEDPRHEYDDADAAIAASLAGALAHAVRVFPTRSVAHRVDSFAPGVILVGPGNTILAMSGEARAWLEDLVPGAGDETHLRDVTRVVFDAANAARGGLPAQAPVRTCSGRWLWVHGTQVVHEGSDVAVVLQPATPAQLLPHFAEVHALTRRERHVLPLVIEGLATKQIAHRLGLSPYTVNDHLKAVYRKCGTAGREELVGLLV